MAISQNKEARSRDSDLLLSNLSVSQMPHCRFGDLFIFELPALKNIAWSLAATYPDIKHSI